MKRIIMMVILVIMSLLSSSIVLAQSEDFNELDLVFSSLEGQELPGPIQKFVKEGNVNLYIGNEYSYNFLIQSGVLESVSIGASEDPTLDLYVSLSLLEQMESSNNGLSDLKNAKKNGEFTYKAYGFFNKIKFAILFALLDVTPEMDAQQEDLKEESEIVYDKEGSEKLNGQKDAPAISGAIVSEINATEDTSLDWIETSDTTEEEVSEPELEVEEEPEVLVEETSAVVNHVVKFTDEGFEPETLDITVGATVKWENARGTKNPKIAMLIGTRGSRAISSGTLSPGESFTWTFEESGSHVFVGGIMTTQTMKLNVN